MVVPCTIPEWHRAPNKEHADSLQSLKYRAVVPLASSLSCCALWTVFLNSIEGQASQSPEGYRCALTVRKPAEYVNTIEFTWSITSNHEVARWHAQRCGKMMKDVENVDSMVCEFKLHVVIPASQESSPSRVRLVEDLATSGVAPASHHPYVFPSGSLFQHDLGIASFYRKHELKHVKIHPYIHFWHFNWSKVHVWWIFLRMSQVLAAKKNHQPFGAADKFTNLWRSLATLDSTVVNAMVIVIRNEKLNVLFCFLNLHMWSCLQNKRRMTHTHTHTRQEWIF